MSPKTYESSFQVCPSTLIKNGVGEDHEDAAHNDTDG